MRPLTLALLAALATSAAAQAPAPSHGVRYDRLLIRNVYIIDGTGSATRGPMDILVEGSRISAIEETRPSEIGALTDGRPGGIKGPFDRVIEAGGMYVIPGLIDVHAHIQFSRADKPMPKDYVYKLLLAHGVTTIRDPGSSEGIDTVTAHARLSTENRIAAPTIVPYVTVSAATPDEARGKVRAAKAKGARGLKVFINTPDVWEAITDEARKLELPVAVDLKVQQTKALDAIRLGIASIEHWYGIPDAAIPHGQELPADYSYDDELDRFRWAGDLWRQADSARLSAVLDSMIARGVTWDPTFAIYEANRDLSRARTQPWFTDYALPQLLANFEPDPKRHGSYFFDWTTADEVRWRENYRIWMGWVREFATRGGNVTVGSDAGFIYQLYGFTTIREMEMQQEAGFPPLAVLKHATSNGAKLLGLTNTGVVRRGFDADLAIVDGNPLHNLKVLYGTGVEVAEDGKMVKRGGVKYTIKDGIVFDAPRLLADVREMVRTAKEAARATAP